MWTIDGAGLYRYLSIYTVSYPLAATLSNF